MTGPGRCAPPTARSRLPGGGRWKRRNVRDVRSRTKPDARDTVAGLLTTFTPSHRGGEGSPLVLLHGLTDTWRTWDLVLPALEREHDVLAPTLAGHAGGPELGDRVDEDALADAIEAAMDAAGFDTAHFAGNSLGGYMALHLAARGRARSVIAFAPSGGWAEGDESYNETLDYFEEMQELLRNAIQAVELIVTSPQGRRRATEYIATNYAHIPSELIAHQMLGAASCPGLMPLVERARAAGWSLDAEKVDCPVRVVWGTADRILEWPRSAARYRDSWLPNADWIELEGIGHCPQLDVPTETAQLILDFTRP